MMLLYYDGEKTQHNNLFWLGRVATAADEF